MAVTELIGSHPQPVRYYWRLVAGAFRSALDVGMLVLGTGLVGLAVAVLLDGFGLVEIGLGLSTGAVLGTGLVLGVCGAFALGVASEGRYGSEQTLAGYPELEVAIGRVVGIIVIAVLLLVLAGRLEPLVTDQALPLRVGREVIRATGSSGFFAALVGVPAAWGMRRGLDRLGWGAQLEIPTLYVLWAVAALIAIDIPS